MRTLTKKDRTNRGTENPRKSCNFSRGDCHTTLVTFAYKSGWRVSEVTCLQWSNVDLQKKIIWLKIGTTKNKNRRTLYLDDELMDVFTGHDDLRA